VIATGLNGPSGSMAAIGPASVVPAIGIPYVVKSAAVFVGLVPAHPRSTGKRRALERLTALPFSMTFDLSGVLIVRRRERKLRCGAKVLLHSEVWRYWRCGMSQTLRGSTLVKGRKELQCARDRCSFRARDSENDSVIVG
jgi:hypothetical protein